MKRCPTCNRVETDDTFAFCRADGTALVSDSSSPSESSLGLSANASSEIEGGSVNFNDEMDDFG